MESPNGFTMKGSLVIKKQKTKMDNISYHLSYIMFD